MQKAMFKCLRFHGGPPPNSSITAAFDAVVNHMSLAVTFQPVVTFESLIRISLGTLKYRTLPPPLLPSADVQGAVDLYSSSAILWFIRPLSPASIRQQFLSPPFPTFRLLILKL